MIEYRTQPEEERFVFEAFQKVCPLDIRHFESRPRPEPDVLACLSTNERIAFELTQVDDENYQQLCKTARELDEQLATERQRLIDPQRWRGYIINVKFPEEVKYGARAKHVPNVIDLLNTSKPGQRYYSLRDEQGKMICSLRATNSGRDSDLHISTSKFSVVGDYTLERVSKKLAKTYETPYPIHLLAWSEVTWLPDVWEKQLTALFRQQTTFERIWVFDYSRNEIVFDSNTFANE